MKQIFINLHIENLNKSMEFYTNLGFVNKQMFSDDHQKCMVWSEHIYVMLISNEKFKEYSKKNISDTGKVSTYFTLLVENLKQVNEIVDSGLKSGGTEQSPMIDEGFMQIRKIEDFDGHIWHVTYMDLTKFKPESE